MRNKKYFLFHNSLINDKFNRVYKRIISLHYMDNLDTLNPTMTLYQVYPYRKIIQTSEENFQKALVNFFLDR